MPLGTVAPDLDRSDGLRKRWLDLARFGVLVTEDNGVWQQVGADLVLHEIQVTAHDPESRLRHPELSPLTPVHDPGSGPVLFGRKLNRTDGTLWGIGAEGALHRIACVNACQTGGVTAIAADPAGGAPRRPGGERCRFAAL